MRALDAAAEAYEDHFEAVEDALGKIDNDLKESLEDLIATQIRQAIKNGRPVDEVASLVATSTARLQTAGQLLP